MTDFPEYVGIQDNKILGGPKAIGNRGKAARVPT